MLMNDLQIKEIINEVKSQPKEYSLGFRRLTSLPISIRRNINLACVMRGNDNDNLMKDFLQTLTDQEFINWLKISVPMSTPTGIF